MLSNNHQTIIFAATGAIASAVAREYGRAGSHLWLAGRDLSRTEELAEAVRENGTRVHALEVDATDERAVADAIARVRTDAGHLDTVFNGIGGAPQTLRYPKPTLETTVEDLFVPLHLIVGSQFCTAREAGRVMGEQGHGAIVMLSATLSGMTARNMAGISATCGAIEALTRALAGDFGPRGVRVNCVRGSAMPSTRTIQQTFAGQTAILGEPMPMTPPPLGRPITVEETAQAALFLGSPMASGMTGQVVTVCAGQFVGQG